ncbi:hypothetical protein O181_018488 [Austropuccinia psidii MF-1]|uniref:Uncharacterized protein n=1 Tax=Austropuccinia psidii MF-1 TaxID=1389203 RepID=A0A9Q3C7Z5_9BASI|nr:hypothetical protein [Austropuccinia psidii MF-1]
MLAKKHTRNSRSLSDPSDHAAGGVPNQDTLVRTPLWLTMMKEFPSRNGRRDPKQADTNNSGLLAQSPQVLICPPPLLGHHPMVTSLLHQSEVIIPPMKDGNGESTFELGPIVTMSCHPLDSNAKKKTNQFPRNKNLPFLVCLASKLRGNRPQAQLAPNSQRTYSVPPIPGPSPSSKPHEDVPTPHPTPPHSVIIIDDMPIGSPPCVPPPSTPTPVPSQEIPPISPENPTSYSPHSHNEALQEFTKLRPTLMIPQAIIYKSINPILLDHRQLLHMIPFVDATNRNEMHWEFWEELNSLLGQEVEAYPKEDITGIVSKYLYK